MEEKVKFNSSAFSKFTATFIYCDFYIRYAYDYFKLLNIHIKFYHSNFQCNGATQNLALMTRGLESNFGDKI